jgi:hypothetical protein
MEGKGLNLHLGHFASALEGEYGVDRGAGPSSSLRGPTSAGQAAYRDMLELQWRTATESPRLARAYEAQYREGGYPLHSGIDLAESEAYALQQGAILNPSLYGHPTDQRLRDAALLVSDLRKTSRHEDQGLGTGIHGWTGTTDYGEDITLSSPQYLKRATSMEPGRPYFRGSPWRRALGLSPGEIHSTMTTPTIAHELGHSESFQAGNPRGYDRDVYYNADRFAEEAVASHLGAQRMRRVGTEADPQTVYDNVTGYASVTDPAILARALMLISERAREGRYGYEGARGEAVRHALPGFDRRPGEKTLATLRWEDAWAAREARRKAHDEKLESWLWGAGGEPDRWWAADPVEQRDGLHLATE